MDRSKEKRMENIEDLVGEMIEGADGPTVVFRAKEGEVDFSDLIEYEEEQEDERFVIRALEGMVWHEQWIAFGTAKEEIQKIFGQPDIVESSYYYFNDELRLDFDQEGKLAYIEFLDGVEGRLFPEIEGIPIFNLNAKDVLKKLKEKNGGTIDEEEDGYSYTFFNLSIGVSRGNTPKDIEEMIAQMKADGVDISGNEELEEEKKKAERWVTFGFGKKAYYTS